MNDTTDIMRAGIWATGQHTFIYCMYIYGLTQASDMLFHTTSYGLAAASLIQMFLFACGIAYCLSWLYRKTGRMWLTVLLSLYYGFMPMVVNMSFSNVKDVFFPVPSFYGYLWLRPLCQDIRKMPGSPISGSSSWRALV